MCAARAVRRHSLHHESIQLHDQIVSKTVDIAVRVRNMPALKAVLADIAGRKAVDATYHLGDLVGYAPWPNDTVQLLREFNVPGVAGNYDSTVASDYKHCGCKYEDPRQEELSHLSFEWTRRHTSAEVKQFLGALPFRIDLRPVGGHVAGPTVMLLHGNQVLNTVYVHEDRPDNFLEKMGQATGPEMSSVSVIRINPGTAS